MKGNSVDHIVNWHWFKKKLSKIGYLANELILYLGSAINEYDEYWNSLPLNMGEEFWFDGVDFTMCRYALY